MDNRTYLRGAVSALASLLCVMFSSRAHALRSPICSNTCTDHVQLSTGNGLIQRPEIAVAFWGDSTSTWDGTGTQVPTRTQLIGSALSIVNSPYYAALNQYGQSGGGMIDLPRLAPWAPIWIGPAPNSNDTTSTYTIQDVNDIINSLIASNQLPWPSNATMTYAMFMPNDKTNACGGHHGCNSPGTWVDQFGNSYPNAYQIAIVSSAGGSNNTILFAHETVEAISAWEGVSVTGGCNPGESQIGDMCQCAPGAQNSVGIQPYWSDADQACVAPEYWGPIVYSLGVGYSFQTDGGLMRQAYGGSGGAVVTMEDDNPYAWDGASTYTALGNGPAAEFASGGGIVASLSLDVAQGVSYFNLSSNGPWMHIGSPRANGQFYADVLTGVRVTANGLILATDAYGQVWYWAYWNPGWGSFGGPIDQVAAVGADVYAVDVGHEGAWTCIPGGSCWNWVSGTYSAANLVGTPDTTAWGFTTADSFFFCPSGICSERGMRYIYAFHYGVSNGNNASSVASGYSVWAQSSDPRSSWSELGAIPTGRLISGKDVYATECEGTTLPCVEYCAIGQQTCGNFCCAVGQSCVSGTCQ
jgi:hypothetical protein